MKLRGDSVEEDILTEKIDEGTGGWRRQLCLITQINRDGDDGDMPDPVGGCWLLLKTDCSPYSPSSAYAV